MAKKRASRAQTPEQKAKRDVRERFRVGVKWEVAKKIWADLKQVALAEKSDTLTQDFHLECGDRLDSLDSGIAPMHTIVCAMLACPASWDELGPFPDRESLAVAGYQSVDLKLRLKKTKPAEGDVLIDRDGIAAALVAMAHPSLREVFKSCSTAGMLDDEWDEIAVAIGPRLKELKVRKVTGSRLRTTIERYGDSIARCRDAIPNKLKWLGIEEELK